MRLLVCGGRDFRDRLFVYGILDDILIKCRGVDVLIHGAAKGADSLARAWAVDRNVPMMPFPADWDKYGKAAGVIRNQQMLDEGKPTLIVAFPGGNGTADMIRRGKNRHIRILQPEWAPK